MTLKGEMKSNPEHAGHAEGIAGLSRLLCHISISSVSHGHLPAIESACEGVQ